MTNIVLIPGRRPRAIVELYWREVLDILPTDKFMDPKTLCQRMSGRGSPGVGGTPRRGKTLKRARRLSV